MESRQSLRGRKPCIAVAALALAAVLALGLAAPAVADGPAVDFSTIGSLANNWSSTTNGFSMGWEFDVLEPIAVSRLGYFNYGPDRQAVPIGQEPGIMTPHEVGIFDSSGLLLVSTTVNPGDPVQGNWVWKSLAAPFALPVGTGYRIAGLTGHTDLYTFMVPSINVDSSIQYVTNRYIRTPTGTLINPLFTTSAYSGYHFFGPNMDITRMPNDVVPEPALLQLPFLLGMGGFAYWRRRKVA